jgi:S-adenosylmethionine:tRNA ribosyltransferase-isomerase
VIDLDEFDFALPDDRIAAQPLPERDAAKLLCLGRSDGRRRHASVRDLPRLLRAGDLLVVNATRVLPARLVGERASGGAAEALLLGRLSGADAAEGGERYRALVRISGRLRAGIKLRFASEDARAAVDAEIAEVGEQGEVVLALPPGSDPYAVGRPPLPPYIERTRAAAARADRGDRDRADDRERYQTVFARVDGAVAAPTAGLHLTRALLDACAARGVETAELVLHVGLGTFRPLRDEDLRRGRLHGERFELPEEAALAVARARERGGRVVAVGTTAARVLESQADGRGGVRAGAGETDLFLKPGDAFRVVDALLTNFHLPRSSLLLLVAAFAGREAVLSAYAEAIASGYRFYSYGDAMLVS